MESVPDKIYFMKENNIRIIPMFSLVVCCVIFSLMYSCGNEPGAKQLSLGEQKEYVLIQKRFLDPVNENLMNAAGWTLIHAANEKEVKSLEKTWNLLGTFVDSSKMSELAEAGGIKRLKDNIAKLLKSNDPIVRGFGAIILAVIGDSTYKDEIAKLLEDKRGKSMEYDLNLLVENWDRSRAAMALGLMLAKEYAPKLSTLLRSPYAEDRTGAALGLGFMGAREYIGDIAKLLEDDVNEVQISAMEALGYLDAKEHAKSIAKLLTDEIDTMVKKTACYALARLNAKEQAKELAELLKDRFLKRDAAKALALLGAKEYTKDIASLLEDSDPIVRRDAVIALGILDAREYTKNVALLLKDRKEFVRAYAATALLLMNDQSNSGEVLEVVRSEWKSQDILSDGVDAMKYFRVRIKLHFVVSEIENKLTLQAKEAWDRLNKAGK